MSSHLLIYTQASVGALTNDDSVAVVDPEFSQRNSHYIFSEQYKLQAWAAIGTLRTRTRLNLPSINPLNFFHQYPPMVAAETVPSRPALLDMTTYPLKLPMDEEMGVEDTTSGAATDQHNLLWIVPDNWNANLPRGKGLVVARATATITIVDNAYSAAAALTFEGNLRGGWYSIVGAQGFAANMLACRLIFPRGPFYQGRRLRPGFLMNNAVGDFPHQLFWGGLGVMGSFHNFELPQVEGYGIVAGAIATEFRFLLVWHDNVMPNLDM